MKRRNRLVIDELTDDIQIIGNKEKERPQNVARTVRGLPDTQYSSPRIPGSTPCSSPDFQSDIQNTKVKTLGCSASSALSNNLSLQKVMDVYSDIVAGGANEKEK